MLVKMSKLEIVGPQKHFPKAVDLLYHLGVVHLEGISDSISHRNITFSDVSLSPTEQEERRSLQEFYARLNGLIVLLPDTGIDRNAMESWTGKGVDEILPDLDRVEKEIREATARKVQIEERITVISRYEKILEVFTPIVAGIKGLKNFEMSGLSIHRDQRQIIPLLRSELARLTGGEFELISQDVDKDTIAVLILFGKAHADKVNNLLFQRQITEIALPSDLRDKPFHEALQTLHSLKETLPRDLATVRSDLAALAGNWRTRITAARDTVLDRLNKFQAYGKFASTKYTFVICGWIPTDQMADMLARFDRAFGKEVFVNQLEMKMEEGDKVPVALSNPSPVRPFEILLSLLPLPKYGSIDPTPIMALFFPLFFGLILGDIGYGVIVLGMGIFMKWKVRGKPFLTNAAIVLIVAALFSIAFGFVFGELFGNFGHKFLHLKPLWKDRIDEAAVIGLLLFSVALGVFHVVLGFILGIVQAVRDKSAHHAIDKVAMLMALAGIFFLIGSAVTLGDQTKFLPKEFFSTGVVLMIISLPVLIWAEGVVSIIEVISTIGNMLSYARLMAIGLSSAILALVANTFGEIIPNFFLAAIVVLLMHAMNLALGIFSPTIHSLRLHYVEFFGKFYKSGGVRYNPFSRTGGAS